VLCHNFIVLLCDVTFVLIEQHYKILFIDIDHCKRKNTCQIYYCIFKTGIMLVIFKNT